MRDAATLARTAVMTGQAAVVRLGENRGPANRHHALAAERLENLRPRVFLDARHRHGRKELTVGKLTEAFVCAGDADESLDVRIPWRDVLVANGPIGAVTVLGVRLKIEIAPTIDLASPRDRSATDLTSPEPLEWCVVGRRIRVLSVLHKKLMTDFVAGVAIALDGIITGQARTVAHTAEMHLPRLHVLDEVRCGVDRAARLEDESLEPALGKLLCRPAAADAGADDDRIEMCRLSHERVPRRSATFVAAWA